MTQDEKLTLQALKKDIDDLRDEVRALVEAWKAAGTLVKFVKWASTFVTAIGAIYLAIKHGFGIGS